jgi:hypothetical protein
VSNCGAGGGIPVSRADRHRYAGELHTERLERDCARLADAGGRLVALNDTLHARVTELEAALAALAGTWAAFDRDGHSPATWDEAYGALRATMVQAGALLAGTGGARG